MTPTLYFAIAFILYSSLCVFCYFRYMDYMSRNNKKPDFPEIFSDMLPVVGLSLAASLFWPILIVIAAPFAMAYYIRKKKQKVEQ